MINKILYLQQKSGIILFIIRLPFRIQNILLQKINTIFWSFFLKKIGKNVIIERGVSFEIPKNVTIGDNVYIGKNTKFGSEYLDGSIVIGNNVQISSDCKIDHTGKVIIEDNVLISAETIIFSHSHGYDPKNKAIKKELLIKSNCWIGYRSMILENCYVIEKNIIIAAGAIVSQACLKEKMIYAGTPAKKIKYIKVNKCKNVQQ